MAFSVANSEIRWAESVPSQTDLALLIQNGPTRPNIGADLAFGTDLAPSILQCVKHGLNFVYIAGPKSFNRLAFGLVSFHTT